MLERPFRTVCSCRRTLAGLLLALLPALNACDDAAPGAETWPAEYGGAPEALQTVGEGETGKGDNSGVVGPQVAWETSPYAVWKPIRQWTEVTAEAGPAWTVDSGLNWEQKYSAWIAGLKKTQSAGNYTTFEITNPQGVTLPAPVLECAETAIFLRATFAAWYKLPFFLEAGDAQGRLFLGHFGFRRANGALYNASPAYQTAYKDHTGSWRSGQPWPSDARLASRGLYGGGDEVPFLPAVNGKPALAGAYFDQLFLDKRVGHFMLVTLAWFGSIHLADAANMYHLRPEAIRPGDVLIERWQRRGIGHTIPVMRITRLEEDRFQVAVATGSMPRRQPVWEEGNDVAWYFTNEYMGGPGSNGDGDAYAALGGGIRRWRTALRSGTQYKNTWMPGEQGNWINSTNLEAIAARTARFEQLLGEMTPEVRRDLALSRITAARAHLMDHPASCSARTRREDAFEELYQVMAEDFGMDQPTVDARYREYADYVFAELDYPRSRTCCWNHSTRAMYDLVLAYNAELQEQADTTARCVEPTIFMSRELGPAGDGFQLFRDYAVRVGRGAEWVAWTADEACAQAQVVNDTPLAPASTPWCELGDQGEVAPACGATFQTPAQAAPLPLGSEQAGHLCASEQHWYAVRLTGSGQLSVVLKFAHAEGDLDLELTDAAGTVLAGSNGTSDLESISQSLAPGSYLVHVLGYNGAAAGYTVQASLQ